MANRIFYILTFLFLSLSAQAELITFDDFENKDDKSLNEYHGFNWFSFSYFDTEDPNFPLIPFETEAHVSTSNLSTDTSDFHINIMGLAIRQSNGLDFSISSFIAGAYNCTSDLSWCQNSLDIIGLKDGEIVYQYDFVYSSDQFQTVSLDFALVDEFIVFNDSAEISMIDDIEIFIVSEPEPLILMLIGLFAIIIRKRSFN